MVNEIITKAEQADAFIFGSPVYYAHQAAEFCLLWTVFSMQDQRPLPSSRRHQSSRPEEGGTTASVDVLNKYFTINQMPVVASTYWNMVHGNKPEEVKQDLEGLQTMRNIASNMAWLLRCIEAGREKGITTPENQKVQTSFIR